MEMNYWRRCCQLTRRERVRNTEIRERMGIDIDILVECKRLKWYGHVERMNDQRWPKRMLQWIPTNRRKKGRPRRSWRQEVKGAMEDRGLQVDDWNDRKRWKLGRVSKFRHLKGTPLHKSFHIENIRNLSRQIPGECDGFQANPERVAVPLSGPGGKIAIFELSKTGKLPDGVIPALVHGNSVMDFTWDPFDTKRLAVACDDGVVKLWRIPDNGLTEQTNEAEAEFCAHSDKIYFIKFHPTAKDVLASGSYDMTIKLWDLSTLTEKIVLKGHSDQIFSFAWSPCGSFCATVSKDSKIRIYKPRSNDNPIREGKGPEGNRGARITWALDGHFIVATGFDKVSERQITAYKANDLSNPLNTVGLDVSPAILIPFYDDDSSTLFVTGKGDSTIYAFEITEEHPFICPLSHHRCTTLHQGLSFLPKNVCDVSNVEFAKALRLTNNSIEPLSFTVPRIKTDLFQDDLFPPTRLTWNPTMSSSEWFSGKEKPPQKISLQPEGMELSANRLPSRKPSIRTAQQLTADDFNVTSRWRTLWTEEAPPEVSNLIDPVQKPGFDQPRNIWKSLNRIRTGHAVCAYNLHKWGKQPTSSCDCGALVSESQGQPNSATERTINKSASSPFIGINHGRVGWDVDSSDVKNKQDEIKRSVSNKLQVNKTLEQDAMEGVDEKEWLE
ncbi:unnamed protein product [Diabrotica balteata]|uniref:Coronin n=1 Tax=Diabrotica balteata TaxID=107213 RepID=A0A9N9SU01_DIABA|nr:unnamed protein product [Diabrotica balteata]